MNIKQNEAIDDLQIQGLKIIQKTDAFKFGTDAVLLSDFAKPVKSNYTLDLCTGSGIVPLLLSAKTDTLKICGIEIQKDIADMAKRSVTMNALDERIHITCADLKDSVDIYGKRVFDLITCNPPYMRRDSAILNDMDSKIIARHEILCTLEDIISVCSKLLKTTGHIVMVHRPSRLCDLIFLMKKYEIEPKRLRFVHKSAKDAPVLVLVDGLYKGKSDVKILPPLIMYDENGEESEELKSIYNRNQ